MWTKKVLFYLSSFIICNYLGTVGAHWIGLTNKVEGGTYVWWHDNTPTTYMDWGPGEPNNNPITHDCIALFRPFNEKWIDLLCSTSCYHICEGNNRF